MVQKNRTYCNGNTVGSTLSYKGRLMSNKWKHGAEGQGALKWPVSGAQLIVKHPPLQMSPSSCHCGTFVPRICMREREGRRPCCGASSLLRRLYCYCTIPPPKKPFKSSLPEDIAVSKRLKSNGLVFISTPIWKWYILLNTVTIRYTWILRNTSHLDLFEQDKYLSNKDNTLILDWENKRVGSINILFCN